MSLFDVHGDLIERRTALRLHVDAVLADLARGQVPCKAEGEQVDLKEEPGRRGVRGAVLPGDRQNAGAVEMLARDLPCMANTPGGGAVVLGVEDTGRQLIGTDLDADWLRHRIFQRVDLAPAIEERFVAGHRLLVLYVAESREPVEDPDRKLRWRVGEHCVPVDRSEWWLRRQESAGLDIMAAATQRTLDDVAPAALAVARRYLRSAGDDSSTDIDSQNDRELMRRLGVLRPDDTLSQAGVLAFCPAPATLISLARLDVQGGDVISSPADFAGRSLIEQLAAVEERLDVLNSAVPVRKGFAETPVRTIPPQAVREAVVNGLIHRDWMQPDPLTVTWFERDSAVEVVSPGGFGGGVTADNVLTQRYARYPALSDLFRALRFVEKQGIGVDRMYREMIALGHRPPLIVEEPGPQVRTRLVGGEPVAPVMALVGGIAPEYRRRDVRVALIVYGLLHQPFLTGASTAALLQCTESEAREALDVAATARIADGPLIVPYKKVWILSKHALHVVEAGQAATELQRRGLLTYRRPTSARPTAIVEDWLAVDDQITSGDYAALTGLSQPGALGVLNRLARDGALVRGERTGRNAHYRRSPRST